MLKLKSYKNTSRLVPLLNCQDSDKWDINKGWMTQETPRKYQYNKKSHQTRPKERPKARRCGEWHKEDGSC